jgi:hypothetical protein
MNLPCACLSTRGDVRDGGLKVKAHVDREARLCADMDLGPMLRRPRRPRLDIHRAPLVADISA